MVVIFSIVAVWNRDNVGLANCSGVAMGWAKSRGPRVQEPQSSRFKSTPAQNSQVITIHNYICCTGVLCTWTKLLTDLQIWGCELHKNVWRPGSRSPDPLGEL